MVVVSVVVAVLEPFYRVLKDEDPGGSREPRVERAPDKPVEKGVKKFDNYRKVI